MARARPASPPPTRPVPARPSSSPGFPGFIGARLIPRLLELAPDTTFHCLVQEKFLAGGRRVGRARSPRRTPARKGGIRPRRRRHHGARPRPRGVEAKELQKSLDGLLPPRGRLRPRGRAGRGACGSTSRARGTSSSSSASAPHLAAPRLRLDGVRLGHGRRHVPRDGPRRRADLQELLRGDEVPRRGGREGERPSRRDLPARASSSATRGRGRRRSSTAPTSR